ncbi:MAG TPA: B-box zinc finger protein [Methylomirabilota bacterium]|nr:B-box zinc finger protein [Methylomirabilota bacterium]
MKCAVHPEVDATGFCRNCGKALCSECVRDVKGIYYCEPCLAAMVQQAHAPVNRRRGEGHAWAAFGLGFIPGLGAVYNGEYTKAIVHVAIFAGLITLASTGPRQSFYGGLIPIFCVYMPIEALITARKKAGLSASFAPAPAPTPAMESLQAPAEPAEPVPAADRPARPPVAAIILIVIGAMFLLDTLGFWNIGRAIDVGWPLILIGIGGYLLWKRKWRAT